MKKAKLLVLTILVLIIQAFVVTACSGGTSPKSFEDIDLASALISETELPEGYSEIVRSDVSGENPKVIRQAIADQKNYIVIYLYLYDGNSDTQTIFNDQAGYIRDYVITRNPSKQNQLLEGNSPGDGGYVLGIVVEPQNTVGFLLFQRCNVIAHFDMEVDTKLKFDKSEFLSIAKLVDGNLQEVACE